MRGGATTSLSMTLTYCEYDPDLTGSFSAYMEVQLNKGECLFMRGEVVTHDVNDVCSGRRVVLQTEMSEVKISRDGISEMGWNGEVPGVDCKVNPKFLKINKL